MFAKKAKWKTKGLLYKNWLENKLTDDLPRYSKEKWDDFDADDVLNLIGLAKHKPVSSGLGVTGAFLLGALERVPDPDGQLVRAATSRATTGSVRLWTAALRNPATPTDVRDRAMNYLDKAKNSRSETQATA